MTGPEILAAAGPTADFIASMLSQATPALEAVRAHPFLTAVAVLASSGAGANLLARVLNRIPLGGWYAVVRATFRGVSLVGNTRFGRPLWKPFEAWLENFIGKTADAARGGLDSDDEITTAQDPAVVPPPAPGGPA